MFSKDQLSQLIKAQPLIFPQHTIPISAFTNQIKHFEIEIIMKFICRLFVWTINLIKCLLRVRKTEMNAQISSLLVLFCSPLYTDRNDGARALLTTILRTNFALFPSPSIR